VVARHNGVIEPAPAACVYHLHHEVIPAPPGDGVAGETLPVFADVDAEAEGEEGGLVPVARAVKTEPTTEMTARSALANVIGDTGGPPPEIVVTHPFPLAGKGEPIVPPSSRAAILSPAQEVRTIDDLTAYG